MLTLDLLFYTAEEPASIAIWRESALRGSKHILNKPSLPFSLHIST